MLQKNTDIKKAYASAVSFSILVGFSFLGIKICQRYTDALSILCYRYIFAFAAVIILMVLGVIKINIRNKPKWKLFLTVVFYVGFMAVQVVGLAFSTSIEGAIIFAAAPIIVQIIASLFLGEKTTRAGSAFVCLTVAALMFMIIMGAARIEINPLGTVLLLISSVLNALSSVLMRYARDDYAPAEITASIVIFGFIVFHAALAVKYIIAGESFADYFHILMKPQVFAAGGYLGIGCILVSAYLVSYMLSKLEAVKGTIFGNVSTAISIVAGVVVLGESIRWYHVICTLLIIAGVIGLNLSGSRTEKPAETGQNAEAGRITETGSALKEHDNQNEDVGSGPREADNPKKSQ